MKIFRSIPLADLGPSLVSLGNFDGLHLGHQALLMQAHRRARELNLPFIIIFFEPLPQEFFTPHENWPRLMTWREKVLAIKKTLATSKFNILMLPFNQTLAEQTPENFIQQVLIEGVEARCVFVGVDFHFGKDRKGDINLLTELGKQNGFQVESISPVNYLNAKISSTRIRAALAQNNLKLAARLLGRPYQKMGIVTQGEGRGKKLGFPTANLAIPRLRSPLRGVFAVKVYEAVYSNTPFYGVANLGCRPTFGGLQPFLEVYLFDFNRDLYGQCITVEFVQHLRAEKYFSSVDSLRDQIEKDVQHAKQLFNLV